MKATLNIKEEKLKQFQELVKAFDFRFMCNPYVYNGVARVSVNADHLPMEKCNEFFAAWNMMNMDIREVPQKTKLEKFIKKTKNIFK